MHGTTPVDLATIVSILTGAVIPFITELVVKDVASNGLRSAITSAFSALTGALTTVAFNPHTGWRGYTLNIAVAFFAAFTARHTGAPQVVRNATRRVGLGSSKSVAVIKRSHRNNLVN